MVILLKSGVFYTSKESAFTGLLIEQVTIFADLTNRAFQDNVNETIHNLIN